jgi:hypothetical protein
MAASPGLSLPRSCAEDLFANNPTPTVAAPPASRPFFTKERRSTERVVVLTDFFMVYPADWLDFTLAFYSEALITIGSANQESCHGEVRSLSLRETIDRYY